MNHYRRKIVLGGAAASPFLLVPQFAKSEDWPSRPIRMVVPGAAGSGVDSFARLIGSHLAIALGQPIVIDNKPGANGVIASDMVAKAEPDGYTLLFSNGSSIVVNVAMGKKMPYEVDDLQAISQVSSGGVLLVANSQLGVKDLATFVDYVKRKPGQPYGTWGIGSTGHIAMEWIAAKKGLEVRHVPYKSVPQILNDLRAGLIDIAFLDARFSAIPMVRSGHLAPVAVTGTARSTAFPEVPTLTEQGMTMNADGWYGMFTSAKVPEAIVNRINREVTGILTRPETLENLRQQHIVSPPIKSPKEFAETIREDIRIWTELIQAAGLGT